MAKQEDLNINRLGELKPRKATEVKTKPKQKRNKKAATFTLSDEALETIDRATFWDRYKNKSAFIEKAIKAYAQDKDYQPVPDEDNEE